MNNCDITGGENIEFIYMERDLKEFKKNGKNMALPDSSSKYIGYMTGYRINESHITISEEKSNDLEPHDVKFHENKSGLLVYDVVGVKGIAINGLEDIVTIVYNGHVTDCYYDVEKGHRIVPKFFCEAIPLTSENCGFIDKSVEKDYSYGGYGDYYGEMTIKLSNMEHERGIFISKNEAVGTNRKTGKEEPTGIVEMSWDIVDKKRVDLTFDTTSGDIYDAGAKNVTDYIVTTGGFVPWHEFSQ